VEAFREYWQRLNADGMLAINRSAILRAASLSSVVLQEQGIDDPENYVMVTTKKGSAGDTGFYLKKGRVTPEDVTRLQNAARVAGIRVVYAPTPAFQQEENIYYRLLNTRTREAFIRGADVELSASTDNWPFFDHYQRFGQFSTEHNHSAG